MSTITIESLPGGSNCKVPSSLKTTFLSTPTSMYSGFPGGGGVVAQAATSAAAAAAARRKTYRYMSASPVLETTSRRTKPDIVAQHDHHAARIGPWRPRHASEVSALMQTISSVRRACAMVPDAITRDRAGALRHSVEMQWGRGRFRRKE